MTPQPGAPTDFESLLTWEALTDILSYDPAKGEFRWVKSARPGKSGVTGVTQQAGKWVANGSLNSKRVYLGIFDTIEQAAAARAAFDARERQGFVTRNRPVTAIGDDAEVVTSIRKAEYLVNRR